MLRALTAHGIRADMVVGASIGALNGAYYASRPDAAGVVPSRSIRPRWPRPRSAAGTTCSTTRPCGGSSTASCRSGAWRDADAVVGAHRGCADGAAGGPVAGARGCRPCWPAR
ncbi:patatin-like phospholipase family protein [Microbispora bryophytorum]